MTESNCIPLSMQAALAAITEVVHRHWRRDPQSQDLGQMLEEGMSIFASLLGESPMAADELLWEQLFQRLHQRFSPASKGSLAGIEEVARAS
jgi:hypothetical protein